MKILLASLIALTPVSAFADEYQAGYSSTNLVTDQSIGKSMFQEQKILLVM